MEKITHKVAALGGIITTADIASEAEYKRIHRAAQRGELTRLRSGVYASPDAMLDTMLDIERIVPGGVVCLYNAWSHYQLTTAIPPSFCVAVERKRKVVIPPSLPITLYYWKKENLSLGVIEAVMSGHTVRITNLERSVCDAVKYRNKIGIDICAEIVRTYLRKDGRNLSLLTEYAKRLRIWSTLKNYLEIAIE
ncbi:MAG: type IV toxin-antitoxin system AbiEi family antitoxin domain-containing protein [Prevotellaceae bacterium]|nr:type IV toxin-antitoxin system AbiEi family antitoxin domain-containing protein [Prevotellaceae bacterium]